MSHFSIYCLTALVVDIEAGGKVDNMVDSDNLEGYAIRAVASKILSEAISLEHNKSNSSYNEEREPKDVHIR